MGSTPRLPATLSMLGPKHIVKTRLNSGRVGPDSRRMSISCSPKRAPPTTHGLCMLSMMAFTSLVDHGQKTSLCVLPPPPSEPTSLFHHRCYIHTDHSVFVYVHAYPTLSVGWWRGPGLLVHRLLVSLICGHPCFGLWVPWALPQEVPVFFSSYAGGPNHGRPG